MQYTVLINNVHLLPKDLRLEYGGEKFASDPGWGLTSLHPCAGYKL